MELLDKNQTTIDTNNQNTQNKSNEQQIINEQIVQNEQIVPIKTDLLCDKHNSKIGGICGDTNCEDIALLCIKCATDKESCIRKYKHPLIDIDEYFQKFNNDFSTDIIKWKEILFNNINNDNNANNNIYTNNVLSIEDKIKQLKEYIKNNCFSKLDLKIVT